MDQTNNANRCKTPKRKYIISLQRFRTLKCTQQLRWENDTNNIDWLSKTKKKKITNFYWNEKWIFYFFPGVKLFLVSLVNAKIVQSGYVRVLRWDYYVPCRCALYFALYANKPTERFIINGCDWCCWWMMGMGV